MSEDECRPFLDWLKTLPCCVCRATPCDDPHHMMRGVPRGMGKRAADRYAVPACRLHHDCAHAWVDDRRYFASVGIANIKWLADALWQIFNDGREIQRAYDAIEQARYVR